jgi:F-type H+-transporting ATPase subunit epsilon
MATFHLTIVTPAATQFDGDAESLVAPGEMGAFGVLAHHAPMIAGLRDGVMAIRSGGTTSYFVTGEGVLEVNLGNEVMILCDKAEPAASLEAAKQALAG